MRANNLLDLAHTFIRKLLGMANSRLLAYRESGIRLVEREELVVSGDALNQVRYAAFILEEDTY